MIAVGGGGEEDEETSGVIVTGGRGERDEANSGVNVIEGGGSENDYNRYLLTVELTCNLYSAGDLELNKSQKQTQPEITVDWVFLHQFLSITTPRASCFPAKSTLLPFWRPFSS